MKYIRFFDDLRLEDVSTVGGKNASLGQMIGDLGSQGIQVPFGYAITADGYWHFLRENKLVEPIQKIMGQLTDYHQVDELHHVGSAIRDLIVAGTMPADLKQEIIAAYDQLSKKYDQNMLDVAVRSSATAEDLPTASFAGQQETYLNISGHGALIEACKKCMASLFTDRAIAYRIEQGFDHFKVGLSIGVQKMVRSDLASSGVAFSLDTESGFKDVVMIDSSYGLGESIVKGLVIPDEFVVHTPTLREGYRSIIRKNLGEKSTKMIYADHQEVKTVPVASADKNRFSLTDDEILVLARAVIVIADHYTQLKGTWCPMDVEWAKDGIDNKIYIVQARPETVHAVEHQNNSITQYIIAEEAQKTLAKNTLLTGQSIGNQIVVGTARIIHDARDIGQIQKGDILVTDMTDPDWVPAMKRAAGIITNRGGRTCHAAIVSRELRVPAIVGTENATTTLKSGMTVTIDCSRGGTGYVYVGAIPFEEKTTKLDALPKLPVKIMVNMADPETAFIHQKLPVAGVGLARMEFIINSAIKIHPLALLHPDLVKDPVVRAQIDALTCAYATKAEFFVDQLAYGIGTIVAAFYPRPVLVRTSDFKSNEYRDLIGGSYFEPIEENPMIGFRGASRYYNDRYKEAFALECAALKKVYYEMGLSNLEIMLPFVRTVEEAKKVCDEMAKKGLARGKDGLKMVMMCEIPSNVLLIDDFSHYFDGFSIGSNDLTQLTLGVDRDSAILSSMFDERDPAVKKMMKMAIEGARRNKRTSGICGQAPSDYPEIAAFVIDCGIDSISLNTDSVLPFFMRFAQ
jgi:pyruvate,water dikinase